MPSKPPASDLHAESSSYYNSHQPSPTGDVAFSSGQDDRTPGHLRGYRLTSPPPDDQYHQPEGHLLGSTLVTVYPPNWGIEGSAYQRTHYSRESAGAPPPSPSLPSLYDDQQAPTTSNVSTIVTAFGRDAILDVRHHTIPQGRAKKVRQQPANAWSQAPLSKRRAHTKRQARHNLRTLLIKRTAVIALSFSKPLFWLSPLRDN